MPAVQGRLLNTAIDYAARTPVGRTKLKELERDLGGTYRGGHRSQSTNNSHPITSASAAPNWRETL